MPKLILGIATALVVSTSSASAQNFHFADFASEGQSFEGAQLGPMTLRSQSGVLVYSSTISGLFDGYAGVYEVTMSFSQRMSAVSIRAGDNGGDSDAFGLRVYGFGTGTLLGTFYTRVFGGPDEPDWEWLTVSGLGDIGRVVFDPCNGGVCPGTHEGIGGVLITDINLTPSTVVPEPASVTLLAGGLLAIACRVRRRREKL